MRVETKQVYYCDHCRKHRLMRSAMEKHELYCTMNPERTCRWSLLEYMPSPRMAAAGADGTHRMRRGLPRWVRMFAPLEEPILKRLRDHTQGCPACMLAAVRQSGLDIFARDCFSYDEEVKRYREEERDHWEYEEKLAIEATFL